MSVDQSVEGETVLPAVGERTDEIEREAEGVTCNRTIRNHKASSDLHEGSRGA